MGSQVVRPTQSPEKTSTERRPSSLRDRIDLRVQMQDAVYEFAELRRKELWAEITEKHPAATQQEVQAMVDQAQPAYDEFDPVVAMALVGADHRNPVDLRLAANAKVAEYVRPRLKSIEVRVDTDSAEERERRAELVARLREFLDAGAGAKKTIEGTVSSPPPSAQDDELDRPEEDHDAGAAAGSAEGRDPPR